MSTKLSYQISKWLVFLSMMVLLVWDLIVTGAVGLSGTISTVVWDLNIAYPMLATACGFVCGHLFSGSARYQGMEKKALTPLRLVSMGLTAAFCLVEFVALVWEPGSWTSTLRSPEYAFTRFIAGAMFGRWFWGGPVVG